MHAILLNIRHGAGRRAKGLLNWLASCSPDLVVLPEWRDNLAGRLISQGLEDLGFHMKGVGRRSGIRHVNGILVGARERFQLRGITPIGLLNGELAVADFESGWRLLGAYFPQGQAKAPFFQVCLQEAARSNDLPFLLLGDLNTGLNDMDVEGQAVPFVHANLFADLQTRAGLVDLWRMEHGDKLEWSWRSKRHGFRIDHALANKCFCDSFPTLHCAYDHAPREIDLTDHSALILSDR
jgi:exonuclease III